jgi:hypothetical protein
VEKQSPLRLSNFFKDVRGNESMTSLLLFCSFWPSTYVMVTQASENIFYAYMAAFTGLAANRQWATRNAVENDSQEVLVDDTGGADTVASEPLARKVKPTGRGKKRSF